MAAGERFRLGSPPGIRITASRLERDEAAHFAAVFSEAQVDGALAASVFHSGEIAIPELKRYLAECGIEVRP